MDAQGRHAAGWEALIADVFARRGQTTVLSALERPLRTDVRTLLDTAWEDGDPPAVPDEDARTG